MTCPTCPRALTFLTCLRAHVPWRAFVLACLDVPACLRALDFWRAFDFWRALDFRRALKLWRALEILTCPQIRRALDFWRALKFDMLSNFWRALKVGHGCLPQARNRNTEGSNSAFNRKVKIQDGRQRVKKEEARKKAVFVLNSFPLSRGDLKWDFHERNPYLS